MQKNEIKSNIEAILFALGDAVDPSVIAAALGISEVEAKIALGELINEKSADSSGLEIVIIDGCYQLRTKKSTYESLIKMVQTPKNYRMTDVQLETLSIIAYKQPVTKGDIEKIRGVSSDHAVNRLIEIGLIEERGRLDTPGRPMLFGTTTEFLRRFGLASLDELPDINIEKTEAFKAEAESEIGYRLDGTEAQTGDIGIRSMDTAKQSVDVENRSINSDDLLTEADDLPVDIGNQPVDVTDQAKETEDTENAHDGGSDR